jgi:exopolyphosphatase / guanosine-5'-triphosphate,3'-diphosphate pyrophosphatase
MDQPSLLKTQPATDPVNYRIVLHFGATAVSLMLVESDGATLQLVEYMERPMPMAREIFSKGLVSRETMDQCAIAVKDFLHAMENLHLDSMQIFAYTTNILLEAKNQEIFLNRMQLVSGSSEVRPIDDGEMTRLIYLGTRRFIEPARAVVGNRPLVVHIGPGNTRALYFDGPRIKGYSSYRLGIYRAQEALGHDIPAGRQGLDLFEENIQGVVESLHMDYAGMPIDSLVAVGTEIQLAAPHLGRASGGVYHLTAEVVSQLARELADASLDHVVKRLRVNYTVAGGIASALQSYASIAEAFQSPPILVPQGDFHQGYMFDLVRDEPTTANFQNEVIQSAEAIADRYKCDKAHYRHVSLFARKLFRDLGNVHGLDARYELLLRVAAILHETGMFVNAREHHKHSLYLILNTEIFGVNSEDRLLIALVARYHRRYKPDVEHEIFRDLDREQKRLVYKLSALLRVADALDRSHSQRIKNIKMDATADTLFIRTPDVPDCTLEQLAIDSKGDLFQEIFGYEIVLTPVQRSLT